jgi:hypothetical protein
MKRYLWAVLGLLGLVMAGACSSDSVFDDGRRGGISRHGATGLWVLANISYAGMRAQSHPSVGWRILAFIFGFPGTLISWLAVQEGSCRAYGITLPRPRPGNSDIASWQPPTPPADTDTPS